MAEYTNTLAGLLQMNDRNLAQDMNVTDLLQDTPLLRVLFAKPASEGGTLHKYLKETTAASATFRAVNTGILNTASKDTLVTATCAYLDGSFFRDVAVADGFRMGRAAYMAKETQRAMKQMMVGLEKQILQSTGSDASGFVGFPSATTLDQTTDTMVYNAGGSGGRSVYLVRTGVDDVAIVAGNDGNLSFNYDPDQQPTWVLTNVNGTGYMALQVSLGGWFTLQFGSIYSVARICNIDGTTSHKLTDAFISATIAKFPAAKPPTHIVMDRTSLQELQASRTATNPTGAPAPFPDSAFGIPIIVTDQAATSESAITTSTTTTTTAG